MFPQKSAVNILNAVGTRIWELSDGRTRLSEIVSMIHGEFEVGRKEAETDTLAFVYDLADKDMLVIRDEPGPPE
ncbi:MAG: PqqD family protein [Candidatus Latescibacterota bacterium]